MNPNKRVCIVLVKDMQEGQDPDNIIKAGDRVMRTTLSFATQMIATGYWNYCSKSKLKSFLNKNAKLTRNMRTLEAMQNIIGSNLPEKRLAGKTIIICPTFKVEPEKGKTTFVDVVDFGQVVRHSEENGEGALREVKQFIPSKLTVHYDNKSTKLLPHNAAMKELYQNHHAIKAEWPTKSKTVNRAIKRDSKTFLPIGEKNKFVNTGTKILVVAYPQG